MAFPGITFSTAVFTFQVVLLILFAVFVDYAPYDKNTSAIPEYYPLFQDVHVMIFVGFGFLMTFLKKYGYGAVSYNLFISAAVIQWAMLVSAWVSQAADKAKEPARVKLTVKNLITSDFTAGAVLITFGAILGKVSRLQLFAVGVFEVVFYAINELVLVHFLKVSDVGGSLVIHMFGAYFGLAVARVNYREDVAEGDTKEGSTVTSDLFSMIGTLFLWMYWPSFNGAMLGPGSQQQRAIINTYLSLVACTVMTFVVSPLVHKNFKLNMVHIQNATIAGGVAVGTCADLDIRPWGAILIGIAAGTLSVLGYAYVTPALNKGLKIHDTCGVHNLHGMPAIMAGVAGAIAAAVANLEDYGNDLFSIWPARTPKIGSSSYLSLAQNYTFSLKGGDGRSKGTQAGFQMAAVCVTFAISVVGGLLTGTLVKFLDNPTKDQLFDDEAFWEVPEEDSGSEFLGDHSNDIKMKVTVGAETDQV